MVSRDDFLVHSDLLGLAQPGGGHAGGLRGCCFQLLGDCSLRVFVGFSTQEDVERWLLLLVNGDLHQVAESLVGLNVVYLTTEVARLGSSVLKMRGKNVALGVTVGDQLSSLVQGHIR